MILSDVDVGPLAREDVRLAAAMAARALSNNPISLAVFGEHRRRREHALEETFCWTLNLLTRPALVAARRGVIIGLVAAAAPQQCFVRQMMAGRRTVHLGKRHVGIAMPSIPWSTLFSMARVGPRALARMSTWSEVVAAHDPDSPHQHVELVAVEPALQGLGIGQLLMRHAMEAMAIMPAMAYLETDTPENVRFYERLGFQILDQADILGVTMWYMGYKTVT